jgi:hypothetical protein
MAEATGDDAAEAHVVHHWKALRVRVEGRIDRLESSLQLAEIAEERRYERLLRMKRLHAKLAARERLARYDASAFMDRAG